MLNLGSGTNLGSAYGEVNIKTEDAERNVSSLVSSVRGAADQISSAFDGMGKGINQFGQNMKSVGESMTTWITLPLVGVATAATKFSTDFNREMANVASLGGTPERIRELKASTQDMAIEFGQSTSNMAQGLYQLISAYGDTEDTQESLRINTQAAAAGLATLEESIALTSAVTKGYGDTSAAAQQQVADLAFQTVKLGQTTFPELASSMGKVVPIAAELGESQDALFAKFATLTGVTGSAAEVSTQLRATYQSILAPSRAMADVIADVALELDKQGKLAGGPLVDAWRNAQAVFDDSADELSYLRSELLRHNTSTEEGAAAAKILEKAIREQEKAVKENEKAVEEAAAGLGKAVVESQGFDATLQQVSASAGGNTDKLNSMFGSVEALTAVLALGGGQQDTYTEKLNAMSTASGAAEEAFAAQTEGINATGFTMQQVAIRVEVMAQKLGDGLAPAIMDVITAAEPFLDALVEMADKFANMDAAQQKQIITIAAVAAAIGPAVTVIGTLISAGGTLVTAVGGVVSAISGATGLVASLGAILNPVGLVVAAVAGLAAAWVTDFGGIRTATVEGFGRAGQAMREWGQESRDTISRMRESMLPSVSEMTGRIVGMFGDMWRRVAEGFDVRKWIEAGGNLIRGVIEGIQNRIGDAVRAITGFGGALLDRFREMFGIRSPSTVFAEIGQYMMQGLEGGLKSQGDSVLSFMNEFGQRIVMTAEEVQRLADANFKKLTDSATAAYNGYIATVNSAATASQQIDPAAIALQKQQATAYAHEQAGGDPTYGGVITPGMTLQQQIAALQQQQQMSNAFGTGRIDELTRQITSIVTTSFRQVGNTGIQSLDIDLNQFQTASQLNSAIEQLKLLAGTIQQNAQVAPDVNDRNRLQSLYNDVSNRILPLLETELRQRADSQQQNILASLSESAKAGFDSVSNSIRQFVLSTFEKLGMSQADIQHEGGIYAAARLGIESQMQNVIGGILNQLLALEQTTSADVIGQGLSALIDFRSQYNQNALGFYGAGAANTDLVYSDPSNVASGQNIYNFYLDYQTQQSSGSVGQDVTLLNALYGGS